MSLGVALLPEHLRVLPGLVMRPLALSPLNRTIALAVVNGRRYSAPLDAFVRLTRTRDFRVELAPAA